MERSIVLMVGTRPEVIKMLPVYKEAKKRKLPALLCSTEQHTQLANDIYPIFDVEPDYRFPIRRNSNDGLAELVSELLTVTTAAFKRLNPKLILVQGDTATAMASALAAFYLKIPVVHVEAGLRTHNLQHPFPEESNRKIISTLATYHCTPTSFASEQLVREGFAPATIIQTGNTVVDALQFVQHKLIQKKYTPSEQILNIITRCENEYCEVVLVTLHRREAIDRSFQSIIKALCKFAELNSSIRYVFPVHLNPALRTALAPFYLQNNPTFFITEPLVYADMVYLLNKVIFIATDSGGIQEEAYSLSKPVAVLRETTERPEGISAGLGVLTGIDNESQILEALTITYRKKNKVFPITFYGDGKAGKKIIDLLERL